jgi:glutathione S-transferase
MAAIKIYGVPPSTFTRAVRMGCHEKGIDYELVPTFPNTVGSLNPFGKIPAMTHGELTLFESSAILRYLDQAFAGPKLWPADARAPRWSTSGWGSLAIRCSIVPSAIWLRASISCRYRPR